MSVDIVVRADSVIAQAEGFLADEMAGEVVIMSIERNEYYAMNPVASRIWRFFSTPRSVNEVYDLLFQHYAVQREELEQNVLCYLKELLEKGIIRVIQ